MKELSLNILDIAQNSVKAGAKHLTISLDYGADVLTITIIDDGCGMSAAFVSAVTDPFTTTRTTRNVGMGLPLFKLAAEQTGGTLTICSKRAEDNAAGEHGTTVTATFYYRHMDCAPLGDVASTITTLIQGNPTLSLVYDLRSEAGHKRLSTDEMREMLGEEVPLNEPSVLMWIKAYIEEPLEAE